ncbi:hypothetical protein KO317_04280 [Candidatus Micrarchaeota archaeon]|jgi:competence protein ComEC|nr:hypothetical protein [Candidatus Micrarchaeota archaeon]
MQKIIGVLFLIVILAFGCTVFEREEKQSTIPDPNQSIEDINENIYQPPKPVYENVMNNTIRYDEQPSAELEIYFINVGMGDSILLKKGNFDVLIDAGGQGEKVINFLEEKKVDDLELVIATKYTQTSVSDMRRVLQKYKVEQYWDNGLIDKENIYYDEIYEILESKNIPVKHPISGERIVLNGISISVLNPQEKRYLETNPTLNSITLYIVDRNFSLYLSDVEAGVQNTILSNYPNIKSNIMKVPNHGASTVSVGGDARVELFHLIDKVKPEYAIISVGQTELEIPNPTVLEAFRLRGAKTLRTDLNGTISIITDGYEYEILSSNSQNKK